MTLKNGHSSGIDNIGHTNMQGTFGHSGSLTVFLVAHSCYKMKNKTNTSLSRVSTSNGKIGTFTINTYQLTVLALCRHLNR